MKHQYSIQGMTCSGCAATVENALASVPHVTSVKVNLDQSAAEITMDSHVEISSLQTALKHFPTYQIFEQGHSGPIRPSGFWQDGNVWNHASLNTLNCLIGCSIGDFAMILFLQRYYPGASMGLQMVLATIAGLITSVGMETLLLKSREKFGWSLAFQTAVSMSFISMIAMEVVMNATDFMITGGKAAFGNPMYWTALIVAMVAGFLAPLPYNYYKLKKFNKACH
jgi:copper chaperone CopZ